jgi:hypothetical protein
MFRRGAAVSETKNLMNMRLGIDVGAVSFKAAHIIQVE